MSLPELHLSKPGVTFPATRVDNAEILGRVRKNYRGAEDEWPAIESAIQRVFAMCKTNVRYLEPSKEARVADYAVEAAKECLRGRLSSKKCYGS